MYFNKTLHDYKTQYVDLHVEGNLSRLSPRADNPIGVSFENFAHSISSFIFFLESSFNKTTVYDVKEVINCFCQCYDLMIKQSGAEWKSLPTLRIFYPLLLFNYDNVIKGQYLHVL